MKAMPSSYGPSGHHGDDHLGHKTNEALYFQDIQPMVAILTYIALVPSGALIPSGAKSPFAILGGRSLSGKQNDPNGGIFLGVIKGIVEFSGSFWAKCVANFRAIKRNACYPIALFIGDVLVFLGCNPVNHDRLI
jgi:hypothetical protein